MQSIGLLRVKKIDKVAKYYVLKDTAPEERHICSK